MARSTHAYTAWVPGFVAGGLLGLLLQRRQQELSKKSSIEFDRPPLTEEQKDALASMAQALATRGKGILAADESTPTVRIYFGLVRMGCPHRGAEPTESGANMSCHVCVSSTGEPVQIEDAVVHASEKSPYPCPLSPDLILCPLSSMRWYSRGKKWGRRVQKGRSTPVGTSHPHGRVNLKVVEGIIIDIYIQVCEVLVCFFL